MRLLLVEPHLIVRQSLRLLLERQNGTVPGPQTGDSGAKRSGSPGAGVFEVVGEAAGVTVDVGIGDVQSADRGRR